MTSVCCCYKDDRRLNKNMISTHDTYIVSCLQHISVIKYFNSSTYTNAQSKQLTIYYTDILTRKFDMCGFLQVKNK